MDKPQNVTVTAAALESLNVAYLKRFATNISITGSYRTYQQQVDVYARTPSLAAKPGTSNRGWALAVDLAGGINSFDTVQHSWMRANAPTYGWIHPAWAEPSGSMPEAWHWEFSSGNTPPPIDPPAPPPSDDDALTPLQDMQLAEAHWMLSTQDLPGIRTQTDRLPTIHAVVDLLTAGINNITNGVKQILSKLG